MGRAVTRAVLLLLHLCAYGIAEAARWVRRQGIRILHWIRRHFLPGLYDWIVALLVISQPLCLFALCAAWAIDMIYQPSITSKIVGWAAIAFLCVISIFVTAYLYRRHTSSEKGDASSEKDTAGTVAVWLGLLVLNIWGLRFISQTVKEGPQKNHSPVTKALAHMVDGSTNKMRELVQASRRHLWVMSDKITRRNEQENMPAAAEPIEKTHVSEEELKRAEILFAKEADNTWTYWKLTYCVATPEQNGGREPVSAWVSGVSIDQKTTTITLKAKTWWDDSTGYLTSTSGTYLVTVPQGRTYDLVRATTEDGGDLPDRIRIRGGEIYRFRLIFDRIPWGTPGINIKVSQFCGYEVSLHW